jgi:hypothetical protein
MQLRPFKPRPFSSLEEEMISIPKIRPTAGSLRADCRQGSKPASRRSARASLRVLDCRPRSGVSPSLGGASAPPFSNKKSLYLPWRKKTGRDSKSKTQGWVNDDENPWVKDRENPQRRGVSSDGYSPRQELSCWIDPVLVGSLPRLGSTAECAILPHGMMPASSASVQNAGGLAL